MKKALRVTHVFWGLLASVLLMALISQAVAVWVISRPFLLESQREAADIFVEREATRINSLVEPAIALSGYVASEPSIVSYVLGDVEKISSILTRLANFSFPEGMSELSIFDFSGREISRYEVPVIEPNRNQDRLVNLASEKTRAAKNAIESGSSYSLWLPFNQAESSHGWIISGVPVFYQGLVEGAVVSVVVVHLGDGLPAGGLNATPMQLISLKTETPEFLNHVAPTFAGPLAVVLRPDVTLVHKLGQELVSKTTVAVSAALLLPFAVFALAGRQALLRPHLQIEKSRNQLRAKQKELAELASIARRAEEAIIVTDLKGQILWTNPAFSRVSGYSSAESAGRKPGELLQGKDTDQSEVEQIRIALNDNEPVRVELLNYSKAGFPFWNRLSISPLFDENSIAYGYMSVSSDISEQKAQESRLREAHAEIERQALHDELTGLANRRSFNNIFEGRCQGSRRSETSVLRIDLDHFKSVNDTMGHDAGDFVLCEVARILNEELSEKDIPVRIGGDEFVVLFSADAEIADVERSAERLRHKFAQPFRWEDKLIRTSGSFGIACSASGLVSKAELVRAADAALYKAKADGRNRIAIYDQQLHDASNKIRKTATLIRTGLEKNQFVPFYQPQVCAHTHEVVGVEVLARWCHPTKGVIPPSGFLDIARQLSILSRIDQTVTEQALDDVDRLHTYGRPVPKISFNITANRLADPSLVKLADRPTSAETRLSFEILESVFLDDRPEFLDFALDLMRDKGISIEIDDFGSGHASMISLMQVRPDVLKIDQRLVRGAPENEVCRDMARSIVDIAISLGISVTAEGVESIECANLMRDMGCSTLQGYYFAEPMSFQQLRCYLDHRAASGNAA